MLRKNNQRIFLIPLFIVCCSLSFADDVSFRNLLKDTEDLFNQGYYEETEANCRKILGMNPNFYPAYNILGSMYAQKEGNENKAISYFEKSLAVKPGQPNICNNIALKLPLKNSKILTPIGLILKC